MCLHSAWYFSEHSEHFRCENDVFIMSAHLCDGLWDCGDSSDENDTYAKCPSETVLLSFYRHISSNWPLAMFLFEEFILLLAEPFLCDNENTILSPDQECDGTYDCDDKSDEFGCGE